LHPQWPSFQDAPSFEASGGDRAWKGERCSMPEADYAELVTAAHHQLPAPVILV